MLERGPAAGPLFGAFFEAVQQAGYPLTDDVNGYRQEGFAAFDRNIHRGRRLSAARAYLHPVMDRPNLEVRDPRAGRPRSSSRARARSASTTDRSGRDARARGAARSSCAAARSTRPSCCSCPAWATPSELEALGVDVVHDLPGVGEHLQDHLEVYVQYGCTQPVSVAPALKWRNRPKIGLEWLFMRSGPGATNHFEAGGFVRSNDEVAYPNLMFHFLPLAIRYDGSAPAGGHGYQVHVGPMYSDARGSVKITSTDPRGAPRAALQLPLHRPGPPRVGGGGRASRATSSPSRPLTPSTAASCRPARGGQTTRRCWTGWRATPRPLYTRPAPAGWASDATRCVDPLSMRVHGRGRRARGGRLRRCRM